MGEKDWFRRKRQEKPLSIVVDDYGVHGSSIKC